MTRDEARAWRRWLDRVERRCDVADVPVLINRLGKCLDELEPRLAAEPQQLRLDDVA